MGGYAWVTLATNDAYSLGALVLAHSLRRVGTKYELACLVTPGVTATMREKLSAVFSLVQEVNVLDSKDEANLALLARPELGITFTKLHCWRLTQYEKCVFVDADALVVRNCDELFEREELSAAADVGWPDCFNSGVFVFRPSQQTFASITAFAAAKGSFDGGDQGLLNMYFSDWATKDISKHLPFIYNMCSTATYSYLPAFKQFGDDVRIIHFIGITKPWLQYFDTLTGTVQPPSGSVHLQPLLQLWWNLFCERVHPQLSPSMAGIAGALAQLTLGEARSVEQVALEEHMRKQSWEQGQIDYLGRDSFDNIWKKICETLSFAPQRQPTPPKEDTATLKTTAKETATKETAVRETADASADVKVDKPAVEADKDPMQTLVCEVSKEEKLSATQIPEQKAPALSSEKSITVEAAEAKVPSEPAQLADACAKPTTEPKDVKSCEICTEVPAPQPPAESLPARTTAEQCVLASPQEAAPQGVSLFLEAKEPPQVDSQTSLLTCSLPVQEAATPVTQTGGTELAFEAKPETPAAQDATQPAAPISLGSPQVIAIASPVASETPVEDIAKRAVEFAPDVTQPLTIDPSERHAEMLLAASEISTVSPVPIQVAESVLQAEPKESVLGAAVAVSDQAIATTVTAVHESTDVVPAPIPMESVQLNGSACEVERCGDVMRDAALVPGLPEKTDAPTEAAKESASDLVTIKELPSEALPAIEGEILTSSGVVPSETSSVKESAEQVTRTEAAEAKPSEQIVKTETVEAKPAEQMGEAEVQPPGQITKTEAVAKQAETAVPAETTESTSTERAAEVAETAAEVARPPSEVPESPIAEQSSPMEGPIEAKPPNVPSTPTVTEATPPTSPSAESAQETEEAVAKKSLKKSDSTDGAEGEGADKKAGKKTVKKVTKKPKKPEEAAPSAAAEGAAADGSQGKAKKPVKTTKKTGTKGLEADTSVPETPPPPTTSAAPVPPKRKTKGPIGKKPETEE
ncbi:PREDICTED: nascent polypeptide-associated complex subunit alpha, muscle-specific form isoform X2 [Vollenhovia emeryi]|uniref:nascent polypeptide-associated complex subunit alpha, muscle-specific form isoform X2 n=1 Tax=Vollenhovia emeryi TaxID=411798 RepID=UPI0005F3C4D3|nr:PREDICTED: nascent polypeptide-associated complex subunit alpha, muscle-specific form isoform X2 [Vollenhovia emeryi]